MVSILTIFAVISSSNSSVHRRARQSKKSCRRADEQESQRRMYRKERLLPAFKDKAGNQSCEVLYESHAQEHRHREKRQRASGHFRRGGGANAGILQDGE